MSRHDWQYKMIQGGQCWIVCAECGKEDSVVANEQAALTRIDLTPLRNAAGLSRRMRKARNA